MLRHLRDGVAGRGPLTPDELVAEVRRAADVANWSLFQQAASRPELRGMGTTATIAVLLKDTLFIAQVGDSRAYLVREGKATQLTKDQSLMQKLIEAGELTEEEAAISERRNIILQALGPEPHVRLDVTTQPLRRGDVLVLCSDGLSGMVRPEQIAQVIDQELDLAVACDRLIATANDHGGPDNITVVAARFEGAGLAMPGKDDEVRYREFRPEAEGDASRADTQPWPAVPREDVEARRKQGRRYTRIIAGIGIAILLLALWQLVG
jgi:protein phosphatase